MYNKFAMNLAKFKKISGDKDHTVMEHEDGHTMKISHKALSPKMRKEIMKIPASGPNNPKLSESKKAEGGEVDFLKKEDGGLEELTMAKGGEVKKKKLDIEHTAKKIEFEPIKKLEIEKAKKLDYEPMADGGEVEDEESQLTRSPEGYPVPAIPGENAPMDASSQESAPMEQPQTPEAQMGMQAPAKSPLGQEEAAVASQPMATPGMEGAIRTEAAATAQKARDEEIAAKATVNQIARLTGEYQTKVAKLTEDQDHFIEDVKNGHIDPNKFVGSMDFSQRAMSTAALILGGLGGAMTGQGGNAALDVLNKQIDRDIDAQKEELGKRKTLLEANLKMMGNLEDATKLTHTMMQGLLITKFQQAAAKANNPIAKARAEQTIAQMQAQMQPKIQMMALKQMLNDPNLSPEAIPQIIQQMEGLDPKQAEELRKRMVPGMGIAPTTKDAADVKELRGSVDTAVKGIDELIAMTKTPGRSFDLNARAKADAIRATLIGALRVPITGPGAMNEGERALLEGLIANPTAIFSLDKNTVTRLNTLKKRLESNLTSASKARGLSGSNMEAVGSPETKTLNGVQYKKVQGGWKKVQ